MGAREAGLDRAEFAEETCWKIEREREEEQRAKEAAGERARRDKLKKLKETERVSALHAAAKALAVSQGRTYATMGDYRECNGVPRQVSSSEKNVPK